MSEITNLIKHGKDTYSIFLDGSFFCKLNAETVVKNNFKVGEHISKEKIESAQAENEKLIAFDRCLKLLSVPKTKKQIKDYLYGKGYTSKTVAYCLEKLEEYSEEIGYAIVLATPDDEGKAKSEESYKSRVRQNVVLELGMFLAKLGREKVAILLKESLNFERPSDIQGLIYIPFEKKVDEVAINLIRELSKQGYSIDAARI